METRKPLGPLSVAVVAFGGEWLYRRLTGRTLRTRGGENGAPAPAGPLGPDDG